MKECFKYLAEYIQNKNVLCIPIVSSIDRKTGEYKLDADGNINRIITTFWHADTFKKLYIVLPKKHVKDSEKYITYLANTKHEEGKEIEIIWSDFFGIHAGEQRSNYFVITSLKRELASYFCGNEIDVYMMESQGLIDSVFPDIVSSIKKKLVYWCPVCSVFKQDRSFTRGYEETNQRLFNLADKTIVVSPEQKLYFYNYAEASKLMYIPVLMDRSIPLFDLYIKDEELDQKLLDDSSFQKLFYLPYRLTDEGYKIDEVIDFINKYPANSKKVIYSDPNNSGYMESIQSRFDSNISFMKVSTDRNICYTILDSSAEVTVPYFEDIQFINHGLLWEMMDDKSRCKVFLSRKSYKANPYDVNSCRRFDYVK